MVSIAPTVANAQRAIAEAQTRDMRQTTVLVCSPSGQTVFLQSARLAGEQLCDAFGRCLRLGELTAIGIAKSHFVFGVLPVMPNADNFCTGKAG